MSTISITGLVASQNHLQTISSNVANANTDGFKLQTAKFASMFAAEGGVASGLGVRNLNDVTDFSQGSLRSTGKALDLAISGRGLFVTLPSSTTTAGGSGSAAGAALDTTSRLTRNGAFKMDKDGYIVDLQGRKLAVVGTGNTPTSPRVEAARIDLAESTTSPASTGLSRIEVREDGEIFAIYGNTTSVSIGKVAVANMQDTSKLKPENGTQFSYSSSSSEETPVISTSGDKGRGTVLAGALEGSNVNLTEQLVEMITAQRNYQANAKGVSAADALAQTIINLR
jgi:flagellar hook protein FlgE